MKTGIKVGDIMTRNFVYCEPKTKVVDAAKKMIDKGVGSLIVKKEKKIIGIITEYDILNALAKKKDLRGVKVEEIMTKKVITISPNKDIYDALIKMRKKDLRRLPVVKGEMVVGMITWKDIIKIAPTLLDIIADKIRIMEEEEKIKKAGLEKEYYERYLK
jgi:signal-transduction protein with cAMP-binding, CBS, and nucleotidyltransferase domain